MEIKGRGTMRNDTQNCAEFFVMIRDEIRKLIQQAVKSHWDIDLELDKIKIDYPPEGFGDYSTNVAMFLAKEAKSNPVETAEEIADEMTKSLRGTRGASDEAISTGSPRSSRKAGFARDDGITLFEAIKVVKPGFINFYLAKKYLQEQVNTILREQDKFGAVEVGSRQKVQVEFISANPTGPLTLGNGRGGFYGDVLANVLTKAGFDVEREYYINDVGEQIKKLGHSVLDDEQAVYKGKYIEDTATKVVHFEGGQRPNIIDVGTASAKIIMGDIIKPTIGKRMKIKFDVWFRESELYEKSEVDKILDYLKEKNLAYEQDGALWFKSTQFGDDKDRVLVKADNEKTYLASDIAYLKNKFERGFSKLIYIWGADHHGYLGRLKAAVSALGYKPEDIQIIVMQLVRLISKGKEIRMSKRAGTYVTLDELLDEIPLDVARFFFLMYSPDSHLNFDLDLAKEQSQKNPVYYVQYAYARICSIFKKYNANELKVDANDTKLNMLESENELSLIRKLMIFPEIVEDVVRDYQVHRLPNYALDLVRRFHKFYEKCRVIDEKAPELTQARLALVKATQIVLKSVLDLMGISAPEKMWSSNQEGL